MRLLATARYQDFIASNVTHSTICFDRAAGLFAQESTLRSDAIPRRPRGCVSENLLLRLWNEFDGRHLPNPAPSVQLRERGLPAPRDRASLSRGLVCFKPTHLADLRGGSSLQSRVELKECGR
jgi:hypothetical protein